MKDYKIGTRDRQFLRQGACYRLLRKAIITPERAIVLLAERKVDNPRRLVDLWLTSYPLRHLRGSAI